MKINDEGQITIPLELRERYGFVPDSEVDFIEKEGDVVLVLSGSPRRQRLHSLYGQVAWEKSTDEIMALLRD